MADPVRHPAKFNDAVMRQICHVVIKQINPSCRRVPRVLDPFAGVGKIHYLADQLLARTTGVELEPEWADADPRTTVGDSLNLLCNANSFDAVITSPTYGNRMADHHEATDASRRNTYRHALGRMPTENSSCIMQWGLAYRRFHYLAMLEWLRVVRSRGWIVVNMSNHIRNHVEQRVVEWWVDQLQIVGYELVEVRKIKTQRLKHGANAEVRVPYEVLIVMRTP